MKNHRRKFLQASMGAVVTSLAQGAAAAPAGVLKPLLVPNTLDMNGSWLDLGPLQGANKTITDYSGFNYCPEVDALLLFGGGHAATAEDVVLRFPVDTVAWSRDYAATPFAKMTESDTGGNLRYLTAGKFWQVPGQVPPLRPVARHTYTGFLWSSAIRRMILPCANNGVSYGLPNATLGGNVAEYDPVRRVWEDTGVPATKPHVAYCEDPVSGKILAMDAYGLRAYDPVARRWLGAAAGAAPGMSYAENLVHYPPNDRFYYIGRVPDPDTGAPRVWEFALDRKTFKPVYTTFAEGRPAAMTTNWRPARAGRETGYAYDSANGIIVGGMLQGLMLGFRPLADGAGQWLQQAIPSPGPTVFYCHAYVASKNHHVVMCDVPKRGRTTFAFRWDPRVAVVAQDTRVAPALITADGALVKSLQAACDAAGDITLGSGELHEGVACARISHPVDIAGSGTRLIAAGIDGKGILIVNADTTIDDVALSGAKVSDGNGAAIRHQAGNVRLTRVRLHHNENGVLGPARDSPFSLEMDDCDVYMNGTGTGQTHGVYIGRIDRFVCTNSRFSGTRIGHHIKSRARTTIIQGCAIGTDLVGNESYNVDIPVGGDALVTDCTMLQGPRTDNRVMLNYGTESGPYPGGSLRIHRCTFESTAGGVGIRNGLPGVVADVEDCDFNGVKTAIEGLHTRRNCRLNGEPLPDI
jgi:hypothetical protein